MTRKAAERRDAELRAQVAKRQAAIRARRKAEGRVRLELWPLAEHAEAVKGYAAGLEERTDDVMREHLAELVYCMELALPHLPPPSPTPGPMQRSALAARADNLLDRIYRQYGEEFERAVRQYGE